MYRIEMVKESEESEQQAATFVHIYICQVCTDVNTKPAEQNPLHLTVQLKGFQICGTFYIHLGLILKSLTVKI